MEITNFVSFFISTGVTLTILVLVIYNITKNLSLSLFVAIIKILVFAVYFAFFFNDHPILLEDDIKYFEDSSILFLEGKGELIYLFQMESIIQMASLSGGYHFGYYIYNYLSFVLFGNYYYSPILVNIVVSALVAVVIYKTLRLAGIARRFCLFLFLFLLLHWDLLTWSSFVNLKDIFTLFLTVSALHFLTKMNLRAVRVLDVFMFLVICFVLIFFRFYLSAFLFLICFVLFGLGVLNKIHSKWKKLFFKTVVLVFVPVAFYLLFVRFFADKLSDIGGTTNVITGFIRFMITPFPFRIEDKYSFLLVSSILHWIFLPIMVFGFYFFVKKYFFRLLPLVLLFLLLCIFYGSFAELQGPRHRVILLYFIAFLQALPIYEFFLKKTDVLHT